MLRVEVSATSANLCVGFDVLGLALDLKNCFTFEKKQEFSFKGFDEEFCNINNNLVYDAYKSVFLYANEKIIPVEIGFSEDIPKSRGLGSSSSLIVAGIFAANYFLNNRFKKDELFQLACKMEGHPDNVAPAIYGGLVASYKKDDLYYPIQYDISKELNFTILIPSYQIKTKDARGVLPKELPYSDIVWNLSRIVNLPKAFMDGNLDLLKDLFIDKLHEPYRKKLIKEYDIINERLKDKKCAFAISGSGSCMIVVSKDLEVIELLKDLNLDIKTLKIGQGVVLEGSHEG